MRERGNPKGLTLDTPARYRIRVKGQPDSLWSDRLADLQATAEKALSRLQADWHAAMAKTNERLDQMQALQQAQEKEDAEAAQCAGGTGGRGQYSARTTRRCRTTAGPSTREGEASNRFRGR